MAKVCCFSVARPKQCAVFVYIFVCFSACVTLATLNNGEKWHGIPYNLSKICFGGILSVLCCVPVIVSYIRQKSYRRHPNALIFWRSVADLVLAFRYLAAFTAGLDPTRIDPSQCQFLATWTQAGFIASEAWFFMLTFDMYK
jgi:hypothetical protein